MLQALVKAVALQRLRSLKQQYESLELLHTALLLDLVGSIVRELIPEARFLVLAEPEREMVDWIGSLAEMGGLERHEEIQWASSSDTFDRYFTMAGDVRPLPRELEYQVRRRLGIDFRETVALMRRTGLGAWFGEMSNTLDEGLTAIGWPSLVLTTGARDWDAQEYGPEHRHSSWRQLALEEYGPPFLRVAEKLRHADVDVRQALEVVGADPFSWDEEGFKEIPRIMEETAQEGWTTSVDLVEICTRAVLAAHDVEGEPTGVVVAELARSESYWKRQFRDGYSYFNEDPTAIFGREPQMEHAAVLLPVRILSGRAPLLDLIEIEDHPHGVIDKGAEWNVLENSLVDALSPFRWEQLHPADGFSVKDLRYESIVIDGHVLDRFALMKFNQA